MHNIKNLKIKYLKTKPYYVFEIENFLSEELYNFLYKNFPNVDFNSVNSKKLEKIISNTHIILDLKSIINY